MSDKAARDAAALAMSLRHQELIKRTKRAKERMVALDYTPYIAHVLAGVLSELSMRDQKLQEAVLQAINEIVRCPIAHKKEKPVKMGRMPSRNPRKK